MNRPAVIIPVIIIVNACIWGFAIVMSAHTLSGSGAYPLIANILGGCAIASFLVVSGGIVGLARRLKSER